MLRRSKLQRLRAHRFSDWHLSRRQLQLLQQRAPDYLTPSKRFLQQNPSRPVFPKIWQKSLTEAYFNLFPALLSTVRPEHGSSELTIVHTFASSLISLQCTAT